MEQFVSVLIGCVSIGIILSAPMGPVGILCVQRTLNKGRMAGLSTGVGAALSDLLYCLLTGFGMSFVTEFIEAKQSLLQIFGSAVLLIYALYLIKRSPQSHVKEPTEKKQNFTQDLITGFFFTLSNPLIVFLIIPLFARFGFPPIDAPWFITPLGYIFIVLGALTWWLVITYIVNAIRNKFSIKSMGLINRIMGVFILVLSLYGCFIGVKEYLSQLNVI